MISGSGWYDDEAALLATLKSVGRVGGRTPQIPGYDNLLELGRGGQGVVFEAVQRSTKRKVAIKLLLDGAFASPAARRRFEREVDAVAGLQHPHIVRLYDTGLTAEGYPYYVMEFIDGAPLDAVIEAGIGARAAGHIAWEPVLKLLVKICEAVHYAHQRGVIHRDLKPSNIRVDASGAPHVLDFGLAKSATPAVGPAAPTQVSMTGQFTGSLPWASPEQAAGLPQRVDVRSDVYALGLLLYQFLTGRPPYPVSEPFPRVLDHIRHTLPARPSTLQPGIDDELETIVLKALAKEPERRYQSAAELARDIRRYLHHEPIEAKRDSAWYQLRTRLRRYRLAVMFGSAFLALAIGLAISTSILYTRARRAERAADERSAQAQSDASHSRVAFELLRRYEASRRTSGAGDPATLQAGIDLGVCLRDGGRAEAALAVFDELAQQAAGLPADHWLRPILDGERGEALLLLRRFAEAEPLLVASHARFTEQFGVNDSHTRQAAARLARLRGEWEQRGDTATTRGVDRE